MKQAAQTESGLKAQVVEDAKKLQAALQKRFEAALTTHREQLEKDVPGQISRAVDDALGPQQGAAAKAADKIAKTLKDATELQLKGMRTKLVQKIEEVVGAWTAETVKLRASGKAEL